MSIKGDEWHMTQCTQVDTFHPNPFQSLASRSVLDQSKDLAATVQSKLWILGIDSMLDPWR